MLPKCLSTQRLPQLVLAGKPGWLDADIFRAAARCGLSSEIRFIGYVPENDLPALYSGAICFVYPSYFEGFGLPVVEAMQCGTPVVAGNRTSLPEVIDGAGVLVDPFDINQLAEAIAKITENLDYRSHLRAKGLERAKSFDWRSTARLTLQIYERAYQRR